MELAEGRDSYHELSDWAKQDVPTMWSKLAGQQTDNHWKVVSGWQKAYELTSTHLARIRKYRESLIAAWPPSKSPASAEYVARLDYLIDSLERTYDAASANYTTLSAATTAISSSRTQLQRLNDEYVAKAAQKQRYDEQTASVREIGFSGVGKPPVTDAHLEQLNTKARTIMYGLSSELIQAQAQIRQPPSYKVGRYVDPPSDPYGGGSGPPVIPPIVPVPMGGPVPSSTPLASGSRVPMLAPTAPTAGPVLGGAGPVLGGAGTLAPSPPAGPTPITPAAPLTGGGTGFPQAVPPSPGLPNWAGGMGRPLNGSPLPPGVSPLGAGLRETARLGVGEVAGTPRPLPPGGIIGGGAGSGLGQTTAGGAKARRINPVGGVIGGGGAGTAPAGGAGQRPGPGSGRAPMGTGGQPFGGTPPPQSTGRIDKEQAGRRWDPDNPWETDQGVPPVVLPPDEPGRIDPGPAIGLDR